MQVCGTILEAAAEIGLLTGLVVTSRITHATPASFSAHVLGRDDEVFYSICNQGMCRIRLRCNKLEITVLEGGLI